MERYLFWVDKKTSQGMVSTALENLENQRDDSVEIVGVTGIEPNEVTINGKKAEWIELNRLGNISYNHCVYFGGGTFVFFLRKDFQGFWDRR